MSVEIGDISSFPPSKVFTRRKRVTLSTTAIQILKPNPSRVAIFVTNGESINVRIDETLAPTATEGIPVDAAGGVANFTTIEDGDLPLKEWFAIADSGTPVIRIKELILRPKAVTNG